MNFNLIITYRKYMEDFINIKAKKLFNIDYVFPYQRLVISNTLRASGYYGEDEALEVIKKQIVILPTGAGKSLCFMLPGIIIDGITLIIFPLLSLMADQERRILDSGSTVVSLKGGMTHKEKDEAYSKIKEGRVKFILTNPETIRTKSVLKLLTKIKISQAVIDETHTVSQWGESFRPTYLEVGRHLETIGAELITAFTATASDYIIDGVKKHIFLGEETNLVKGNPDRANISYSVVPCINKNETLLKLVKYSQKPLIIFHSSRVSAEVTNRFLSTRLNSDEIIYYHAGLPKEAKKSIEKWFFSSASGVLNATCAYGMGVDKQNIRTVIHLEAPSSIEAYLQESGRGGRDRKPGKAILLTSLNDRSSPVLDALKSNNCCRREVLLSLLGTKLEYCSGCDICNGTVENKPLGLYQIIAFFQKNSMRFNITESTNILKGYYTFNAIENQFHNTYGFGILRKWDKESIKNSIDSLINNGYILKCKNPLFRGILKLNRALLKEHPLNY